VRVTPLTHAALSHLRHFYAVVVARQLLHVRMRASGPSGLQSFLWIMQALYLHPFNQRTLHRGSLKDRSGA